MKARVSLVAQPVIPVKAKVTAGASSAVHLLKVTANVSSGCPSFDGQRTVASVQTEEKSEPPFQHRSLSIEAPCESLSVHRLQSLGQFSQLQSLASVQAPIQQLSLPALVCFAVQIQGAAAAP